MPTTPAVSVVVAMPVGCRLDRRAFVGNETRRDIRDEAAVGPAVAPAVEDEAGRLGRDESRVGRHDTRRLLDREPSDELEPLGSNVLLVRRLEGAKRVSHE